MGIVTGTGPASWFTMQPQTQAQNTNDMQLPNNSNFRLKIKKDFNENKEWLFHKSNSINSGVDSQYSN